MQYVLASGSRGEADVNAWTVNESQSTTLDSPVRGCQADTIPTHKHKYCFTSVLLLLVALRSAGLKRMVSSPFECLLFS